MLRGPGAESHNGAYVASRAIIGKKKLLRDASLFLHQDATVDISRFKIVKAMFPDTAGACARPKK